MDPMTDPPRGLRPEAARPHTDHPLGHSPHPWSYTDRTGVKHFMQSKNGCVGCSRRWCDHDPASEGRPAAAGDLDDAKPMTEPIGTVEGHPMTGLRETLVPVIHEMYVDGTLEPSGAATLSEIVDRILAIVDRILAIPVWRDVDDALATSLDRERLSRALELLGTPMPPGRLDDLIAFYEDSDDD